MKSGHTFKTSPKRRGVGDLKILRCHQMGAMGRRGRPPDQNI